MKRKMLVVQELILKNTIKEIYLNKILMLSIKLMFNKKDIYQTKYINIQNYFTIIFADDIDINI